MTLRLTREASELLATVPDDNRARVGNWAKRIALANGRDTVGINDVMSAAHCAAAEFLPEPGEYVEGGEDDSHVR